MLQMVRDPSAADLAFPCQLRREVFCSDKSPDHRVKDSSTQLTVLNRALVCTMYGETRLSYPSATNSIKDQTNT